MNVLASEDWPPSIGRHESNLVLIEHGRGTLPGVKDAKQMQKDYVGGKVDRIVERKKEISYEDIFDFSTAIENSEEATYASKHFRMLIDGAPGIGKTVLCRKFCKDWGAGRILQQFSMVWLLHLREERIAKAKTIDDLFQHDDEDLLREVIQQMKKTSGEGNALVCDGFDELSKQERTQHSLFLDIIKGRVLPKCSVIVSSRPYASLELQKLQSITHHVEIVGFTEEQIKECIRRNIPDKPKAEELIQKLKQRLDIFSMCYTPLNMAIVLYIYKQEEYKLPTTLTQLYSLYVLHTLKRSVEIHFKHLDPDDVTNLKCLPDPIQHPFKDLCEMAYNGLDNDQLGYNSNQLPQSLQYSSGCIGTNPELLGLMSGSKTFSSSGKSISYQFTHLTVQEFLAAWHAATGLSAEELSKLFIEKMGDDRFWMMLLFLSGITGLPDTQMYQQIVQKLKPQHPLPVQIANKHIFFLAHLIYESQNTSPSHILASLEQQDGKTTLDFRYIDLFQCTVLTYFLSTSNYPWTLLELKYLTDQQVEVMQQVSFELAGSSDERGERQTPNEDPPLLLHKDTKEIKLNFSISSSPRSSLFSCLRYMKQLSTLRIDIGRRSSLESGTKLQFSTAIMKSLNTLFKVLEHHSALHELVIYK